MRRDNAPTLVCAYPSLALPAERGRALDARLGPGDREIAAETSNHGAWVRALDLRLAGRAIRRYLGVTVEVFRAAVAHGVWTVPEHLVHHRDVVVVNSAVITVECRPHLRDDFGNVDLQHDFILLSTFQRVHKPDAGNRSSNDTSRGGCLVRAHNLNISKQNILWFTCPA